MAARRLNPYRQGRLDGLCGVYALINALRLLCPRLDEDACERVFYALIRARARQTVSPLAVISRRVVSARAAEADRPVAVVRGARVRGHAHRQSAQGFGADPARDLAGLVPRAGW